MLNAILSHEMLDKVADAYIPLLAITFLIAAVIMFFKAPDSRKALGKTCLYLLLMLVISYGLMFLDKQLHIWEKIQLDYSTHTAVSLSLVSALCFLLKGYRPAFIISFLAYIALMLYQQYHSVSDILGTAIPLSVCGLLIHRWLSPR